jgi:hypothetical protein
VIYRKGLDDPHRRNLGDFACNRSNIAGDKIAEALRTADPKGVV